MVEHHSSEEGDAGSDRIASLPAQTPWIVPIPVTTKLDHRDESVCSLSRRLRRCRIEAVHPRPDPAGSDGRRDRQSSQVNDAVAEWTERSAR
jgi:hypothetical protein